MKDNKSGKLFAFNYIFFSFYLTPADETHHSPADSYQRIVGHFTPKILLGLTSTPERQNILADFNDRIAYEIRLREAIERNLLCPFHYFGVSDETDLSQIKWERGRFESLSLNSDSTADIRRTAQSRLLSGEIKFIFVVDLYNEGVDIPEINTVLFLRPTESPTIFIQQFGRGLRLNKDKEVLTVLDFIGQAHKQYDFSRIYIKRPHCTNSKQNVI